MRKRQQDRQPRAIDGIEIDAVTVPDAPAVTVHVIVAMAMRVCVGLVGVFVRVVVLAVM